MNETIALLEKLNWFLEPIADLFIYLFTTTQGLIVFSILLFLYFVFTISNAFWVRRLMSSSGKSGYGPPRLSGVERVYIFFSETGKILSRIIYNFPVLLGIFLFIFLIGGLSAGFSKLNQFIENQERIKELSAVVRQLDRSYKVAEMRVTNVDYSQYPSKITSSLEILYFDYAGIGLSEEKQNITIEGNDIYFDALVLNFDYSEIVAGEQKNITIPYRIFSNVVAQKDGIPLKVKDTLDIPYIFHRNDTDVYNITPEKYNKRIKEIGQFINNPKKARAAGVRSVYGNAVHTKVRKDEVYTIEIEQTGGLVLKKQTQF